MAKVVDFKEYWANIAGICLQGGPMTIEGYKYEGKEAIDKGFQIVDMIRMFEAKFREECKYW